MSGEEQEGEGGRKEGGQLELAEGRPPSLFLRLTLFFSSLSHSLNSVDLRLLRASEKMHGSARKGEESPDEEGKEGDAEAHK